jgi:predicted RNase H-like HicB family nuclease
MGAHERVVAKMATIEFTINVNCQIRHDDDAGVFVSHCPTLNVYSQGETEEEALEAIKEAVSLHVTTAFDFARLDKVLRKAGFEKFSPDQAMGAVESPGEFVKVELRKDVKDFPISLPFHLRADSRQYACVS